MRPARAWLPGIARYLGVIAVGNLAWEFTQMPLYTLWRTGSEREIVFAAIHCTGGDMLIAGASLAGSLLLYGDAGWPRSRFLPVAVLAVISGLGLTVYIEHAATARGLWTYSDLMPVLPGVGTGLAPLAQWVVVPLLAFAAVRLPLRTRARPIQAGLESDRPTLAIRTSSTVPDPLACSPRRA